RDTRFESALHKKTFSVGLADVKPISIKMNTMPLDSVTDNLTVSDNKNRKVSALLHPEPTRCEQPNVALERLAHATMNKGYSPASPLQALVGWKVGFKEHRSE